MIRWHRDWYEQYDPSHIGIALREMRQQRTRRAAEAVSEGWHPFALRNTPVMPDPDRDAQIAHHSAVTMIDAIVRGRDGAARSHGDVHADVDQHEDDGEH